ncbi:hypothetical protein [Calothrix sp. 336/3]|uniref:hypothetical protein n=1 Tax=Calothrix sp. 336/3 TaxID=1337936 RepID=UPI0004E31E24|nr:hypothetical protein [Calothrix sp. 336/3]AKG22434.1 pilus assembly protein PilO [Calothrix sp. 336/3]
MTLSEDMNFVEGGEFEEVSSSAPVAFGITFTPKVIGILVGAIGLVSSLYIVFNMLMPAWEAFQQQQAKQSDLQGQIDQKKSSLKQIDAVKQELADAKLQQTQVMSLFSNEKTLDTLLLDLNRLVESGNALLPLGVTKAKLKRFTPISAKPEIITDGSLGKKIDGKLKRTIINVEIVGTYEQTQSILRNIERLQPLLIVKDYQSTLAPSEVADPKKPLVRMGPEAITTSFQLQALMPLSPEDIVKAAEPKK